MLLALLLVWTLFPLYWMLVSSFKPIREIINRTPTFWPSKFVVVHYQEIFRNLAFVRNVMNSIYLSCFSTVITIFLSLLAGYAIGRLKMAGKALLSQFVLFTYLIPLFLLFIPFYIILARLGLTNKTEGLLLVYPVLLIPYATWIFITYLKSIPRELEESALMDGCPKFGIIVRIIIPLAMPGIMATAIFTFTRVWNDYLMAFILISNPRRFTVMLAISDLINGDQVGWGKLFASAMLSSLPVTLMYFLASKHITTGLTAGAVKY